jgi:tetratricopeptide (TPR) repeat protein
LENRAKRQEVKTFLDEIGELLPKGRWFIFLVMPKLNPLRRVWEFVATAAFEFLSTLELRLITKSCLGHIDGIAVCDFSLVKQNHDNFLNLTRQAMALVQTRDPRRYRRVCRHLKFIVNRELISGGNFARRHKICCVDYSKFTSDDPLWNLRQYAQLLVHEATHGLLSEKGILSDKERRERIERLCRLEEYRFALHFESGYADIAVPPFDSEWYEKYWDGKARRAAEWKRLWEAIKAGAMASNDAKEGVMIPPLPTDAKAYNDLGESYQREGNAAKAITYFSHAIQLDPQFARAYNNRGCAYRDIDRYDEAIRDCDRAIELDAKCAVAYVDRGLTYRYRGDYDKAIADYDRAIELFPRFARAYNNRSYAYYRKREYDRSIADCDRAIELVPNYTTAYVNRARTHRTAGNYEKAIADYSRLIELDPKYASAYNNLAWILATSPQPALRDGKKAVEYATKACELSEWKDSSSVNTLALAYAEVADFENAAKWQSKYLESPNLSSDNITNAKGWLAKYQAHLRGEQMGT